MLCELRVKNLALIETLELSFEQNSNGGLVVMTGDVLLTQGASALSGQKLTINLSDF